MIIVNLFLEPILNVMSSQSDQTELALNAETKPKDANINLDFGYKRGKLTGLKIHISFPNNIVF